MNNKNDDNRKKIQLWEEISKKEVLNHQIPTQM